MKEFVKTMLAVICALIVMQIISFIFFFIMLGGAIASGGSTKPIPREGVLDINMADFVLTEQTEEASMPSFSGLSFSMPEATVGLWDAVRAIDAAAADPGVKYILLRPEGGANGMATTEEFRHALSDFRKSGKPVIAWLESPSNGSYYLATVADKVYLSSYKGENYQLLGLSSQMIFLKDILDKLGVNVQLIRHGKYKSAGEMYVRSSSSPENREQHQVLVSSAWKNFSAAIAQSRGISEEAFNQMVDNLGFLFPEDFLKAGLVDELMSRDQLKSKLCSLAGVSDEKKLHLIPFADYAAAKVVNMERGNVAIIFADGEIVEGDDIQEIAGTRFAREIEKITADPSIKAVVLRVNSPGGSVSASAKIRTALDNLKASKPLVASYGNYAASGGYWISNGCEKIFSDAGTVTGSIGVFSMIPEFSKVSRKLGVTVETVGSNKHSDMYSLMRPFDAAELKYMQASIEDIYETFVNLVADGRGMQPAAVDAIAQGRVWIGSNALEIGLVDEIGTLKDAVAYAASLAGLTMEEVRTVACPKPLTVFEQIMETLGQGTDAPSILSGTPFEGMESALSDMMSHKPGVVLARLPYAFDIQ